MVEPGNPSAVRDALMRFVHDELGDHVELDGELVSAGAGMSTFIWFFSLLGADLPEPWQGELVLRLHPHQNEAEVLEREAAVQTFVAGLGYPAPEPIALRSDLAPDANPFGLPFMVMPRARGRLMIEALTARPWAIPSMLRTMANLQLELHALPTTGCPLPYERPLVDRMIDTLQRMADEGGWSDTGPTLQWLRENREVVRDEEPVLGHNDFHPLNILVDDDGAMTVIDWTDSALGDRHFDTARTIALFWVASVGATAKVERLALRAARGWLARTYERAYTRGLPLDQRRIAYWQVVHLFRGRMQVLELHAPANVDQERTSAAQSVPAALADQLAARVEVMQRRFDAVS